MLVISNVFATVSQEMLQEIFSGDDLFHMLLMGWYHHKEQSRIINTMVILLLKSILNNTSYDDLCHCQVHTVTTAQSIVHSIWQCGSKYVEALSKW